MTISKVYIHYASMGIDLLGHVCAGHRVAKCRTPPRNVNVSCAEVAIHFRAIKNRVAQFLCHNLNTNNKIQN